MEMIVKVFPDACKTCGVSNPNPIAEYSIVESQPVSKIEFDSQGRRFLVFQLLDPPEAAKSYLKAIRQKQIKVDRKATKPQ